VLLAVVVGWQQLSERAKRLAAVSAAPSSAPASPRPSRKLPDSTAI
jgi:hypothetical protein